MKGKKHKPEQIIQKLREADAIVLGPSKRQEIMADFLDDVLAQASGATATKRYANISKDTKDKAGQLYRDFQRVPQNVTGNFVNVNLTDKAIKVRKW